MSKSISKLQNKSGVYIILDNNRCKEDKLFFKIGCSKNIARRYKEIQKSYNFNGYSADGLEVFTILYCNKYKEMEKVLHMCLKCYNVQNEYFMCTEDKLNERLMMIDMGRYD